MWLDPKGSAPARAVIWTDLHSPRAQLDEIPDQAFARVEGWTNFDHRYIPIGGILAAVRANARASIAWELVAGGNHVQVYGHVYPSTPDVPFTVEVTDRTGAAEHMSALTDAEGEVRIDFALQDGRYSLQAFTASTRSLAEAESDIRTLELPAR